MYLTLILVSIYISLVDWQFHRIANKSLLLSFIGFGVMSLVTSNDLHIMGTVASLLFSLVGYRNGLGAGDVKLIALLSLFFLPNTYAGLIDLLGGFTLAALISILFHRVQGKSLADSIALAPSICAAFIWCAR